LCKFTRQNLDEASVLPNLPNTKYSQPQHKYIGHVLSKDHELYVVQRIESKTDIEAIFFPAVPCRILPQFQRRNCDPGNKKTASGKLAISGGNRSKYPWLQAVIPDTGALACRNGRSVKFSANWRGGFQAVSRFCGRAQPVLSRIKARPPIIPSETIRSRAG
jgi:hypothetical protein